MSNPYSTAAVILAAGHGKRMQSEIPKVMMQLNGRPLIDHVVSSVEQAKIFGAPVVVVSKKHAHVQEYLKDRARYAVQEEQLGTGHAVRTAEGLLTRASHVVVLYGDMPLLQSESLIRLVEEHEEQKNTLTLMTAIVPEYAGMYAPLSSFGRIIRNERGEIMKSVEVKDATQEEIREQEVNPCYCCFRADWLWRNLKTLRNTNAQKEYYLPDLIRVAIQDGEKVSSVPIDPKEAIGINTTEDLISAAQTISST